MIRRPPRSTLDRSSAASDVYKRQGYLTVMVKSDYELGLTDVHIQFDKLNDRGNKFEFYKKFDYVIESDMSYVFFAKNSDSDLKFEEPGLYRVFLLDDRDKTVASALIEIISK